MNKALPLSAALFFLFSLSFINLKANDTLTRAQVYSFNVGDTFDYHDYGVGIKNPLPQNDSYYRVIITGKTLSVGGDSLIITKRIYRENDTSDATVVLTRLQEYEINLTQDSVCPLQFSIDTGFSFNGREKNSVTTTSCLNGGATYTFAEGLGMVYKQTSSNSNPQFDAIYTENLIYYSNGIIRWGTPIYNGAQLLHYTPIPEECAVWTGNIYTDYPPLTQNHLGITEQIRSGNKIAFNGHAYIEMIYRSYNYTTSIYTPDSLIGYYRNDTANHKALFYQSLPDTAFLEYDFNYVCPAPNCMSQVNVGGNPRTKWPEYIEGVGGTKGLVSVKYYRINLPGSFPGYVDLAGKLSSLCVCGQLLYGSDSTSNCVLLTGIDPIQSPILSFSIAPNPSSSVITVSTGAGILNGTLTITDMAGRVVRAAKMDSEKLVMATDFASGLYFVTLSNGQQSTTRKLIVSK